MEQQPPRRKKPGKDDFDTSPAAVKQWINELPIINTGKARDLLNNTLEQINMLDISPAERYAAVELLATPVLYVTGALRSEFLGKQIPLPNKHLASARQCLELYNQMATAYEIMAADLGRMSGKRPRLATALHRALRYLSESLLINYQIYLQFPAGLWKSIHTLYTAAEREGRTSRIIDDKTLPSDARSSIEAVYKQILLLSLACPYRLRQKEIRYVYDALLEWADASCLSPDTDKQDSGLFAVNLLSDDPPSYRTADSDSNLDKYWRILDTSKMANLLREAATENTNASGVHTGIGDKETLKRLMLAWGVMPKRRFTRHQSVTPVNLVIGLDSIHRLAEESALEKLHEQHATEEITEDKEILEDPTFEGETSFKAHSDTRTSGWNKPRRDTAPAGTAVPARVEAWEIADMSAGGYRLLSDSPEPTSARVGELAAVRATEDTAAADWHLGVIRRIRFTRERGLELGLQMLSPGAQPVWTSLYRDNTGSTTRMKGILLPEIKSIKQTASLLLPSLPFQVGSVSTLEHKNLKETITLTQQLENTGIFGHYRFTRAEKS